MSCLCLLLMGVPSDAPAAIFGNTNLQTSTLNTENQITGGRFTPSSNGTADSITVYVDFLGAYDIFKVRCALYNCNGGTRTLVDTTGEQQFNCATACADGWKSFALINHPSISSTATYDICAWVNYSAVDNAAVRINSGQSGNYVDYQSGTYGVWPGTLAISTLTNYRMSIYSTYTPGTTAAGRPRRRAMVHYECSP